jgi:hypothetical protein
VASPKKSTGGGTIEAAKRFKKKKSQKRVKPGNEYEDPRVDKQTIADLKRGHVPSQLFKDIPSH